MSQVEQKLRRRSGFDARARTYESGRLADWYKAQGEMVLRRARPRAGDVVLDVGCGTGWLLRRMARARPGIVGFGLDASPAMIDTAREKARIEGIEGLTFVTGDWTRIDPRLLMQAHGHEEVDLVCCVSAFHYFREPEAALRKFHRVLAPGGRLLLLDRARDRSLLTAAWDAVHRVLLRDTVRFYRSGELIDMLRAAGFGRVEVVDRVRRMLWKGKLASSLALISAVGGGSP